MKFSVIFKLFEGYNKYESCENVGLTLHDPTE